MAAPLRACAALANDPRKGPSRDRPGGACPRPRKLRDACVADRLALDSQGSVDDVVVAGDDLERADAIAADGGEQAASVAAFGADPLGDPFYGN